MLKVTDGESSVQGNAHTILAEITVLLNHVVTVVSEETGGTELQVLDTILEGRQLTKLLESGMNAQDAMEIVMGK